MNVNRLANKVSAFLWMTVPVALCFPIFSLEAQEQSLPKSSDPVATVVIGIERPDGIEKEGTQSKLKTPFGVDFDADGQMYIVEYNGGRIWKWDGQNLEHIGGKGEIGYHGDGGSATEATFNKLHNVVVGPGNRLFLSDHLNHCVRVLNLTSQTVETFAGTGEAGFSGDGGPAIKAQLNVAISVALSLDKSTLFVADIKNRRVRAINLADQTIRTVAGNGKRGVPEDGKQATEQPLTDPRSVAEGPDGMLYILERGGHALRAVDADGAISTVAGTGKKGSKDGPALEASMNGPKHVTVAPNGIVYIADDQNHLIRKYDPKAKTLTTILGAGEIKLQRPHGVTFHDGKLYVADGGHNRIIRIDLEAK